MTHFAKVEEGIVTKVIGAEPEFFESFVDSSPGEWIQTSYNSLSGINTRTGEVGLRKNYAGIGYSYNHILDAFIEPKPFESWSLNEETCNWESPVPMPASGSYFWDEDIGDWKEDELDE